MYIISGINKLGGSTLYVKAKNKNNSPVITPFKAEAAKFESLNLCKNLRDDCLEYLDNVTILRT